MDLDKIAKKRQYKLRGVFLSFESINTHLGKVFISKGTGTKKKIYVLVVSGKLISDFMALEPKYRIKIWFTIKCKEHKGNWFTDLIVEDFEHWQVNEDKLRKENKQLQLTYDKSYEKNIYNSKFTNMSGYQSDFQNYSKPLNQSKNNTLDGY